MISTKKICPAPVPGPGPGPGRKDLIQDVFLVQDLVLAGWARLADRADTAVKKKTGRALPA